MLRSDRVLENHGAPWRAELWRLLAFVLLAKCLLLVIDPNLRLFMGDSGSYLHAALGNWKPPDRSITYPELVAWSAVQAQSAFALVMLQTLMGVVGCLLAYWMLRRLAGLSPLVCGLAALLVAIEPTQLFYERMLMAESAGLLALLTTVAATAAYVHGGRLWWCPVIACAGVLTVSFRMSLLPVVLGLVILTPCIRLWHVALDEQSSQWRRATIRAGLDCLVLWTLVLGAHAYYQHAYGASMDSEPTYMVDAGKMRLGMVAPLIQPEHFVEVGLAPDFAEGLDVSLADHRKREAQMWSEGGLWVKLETELGTDLARSTARKLSNLALRSDPLGMLQMSAATVMDYFNDSVALWRLSDDFGKRPPDDGLLEQLALRLRHDAQDLEQSPGLVGQAFLASRWWLTAVLFLLAPVAVACMVFNLRDTRRRAAAVTLGFAALGLVAGHMLFSHIVSFRYLHPMPVFLFLTAALMFRLNVQPMNLETISGQDKS